MRIAVVLTHPIQYFSPVFRGIAKLPGVDLRVFYGTDHGARVSYDVNFGQTFAWDSSLLDGYESVFLGNSGVNRLCGFSGLFSGIKAAITVKRFSPDIVLVFSYSPVFVTVCTLLLSLLRVKLMLRAETTDVAIPRGTVKEMLRSWFLRRYYKKFDCVFPIGANSKEHYSRLGVPENKQRIALYSVDVEYFSGKVAQSAENRIKVRASLAIPQNAHVFMYCGKMFAPKDPLIVISAMAKLSPHKLRDVWLLAVGDGVLRGEFQRRAQDIIGNRAIFLGFKNQSELGNFYSASDTLILPSLHGETWGLVVNEALQFGLRVIASDRVGSSRDLVHDERDGWVFKAGDAADLARCVESSLRERAPRMTNRSIPTPEDFVRQVSCALNMENER